ncbi:MAG: hypothetical protein OEL19_08750 [Sulfurimonas sp.]|nr:hypothetical protein [Sulfurimonas sp.]
MYLSTKELFLFVSPFIVSFFIYFFGQEIIGTLHSMFPSYERYANSQIDAKMEKYLAIDGKHDIYTEIEDKTVVRKNESRWVAEHFFYRDAPIAFATSVVEELRPEIKTVEVVEKEYSYTLQALFPDDKTVIINDLILKEGDVVDGAKVMEISGEKVLLKTNKGLKWLYLFK